MAAATRNSIDENDIVAPPDPIYNTTNKNANPTNIVAKPNPNPQPPVPASTDDNKQDPSFKLHIAIDFGTDGVGLAYAYNGKVFVHSKWSSKKYGDQIKPKTLILLNSNAETMAFGLDAKFSYMALPSQKNEWMLFERFKMSLYESEYNDDNDNKTNQALKDVLIATNGKKMKASLVFIAAFKHLKLESIKFLKKKKIKNIQDNEIQWIITVPAIWNDKAKYKMKEWATKAGVINENVVNQCKIVYEPDCASLAIQYYINNHNKSKIKNGINNNKLVDDEGSNSQHDASSDDDNDNNTNFNIGEKYILVDAGGGTLDITCHEILGNFGVKEILPPSGGPWGSCFIDDEFIKLLVNIFSQDWMNEFQTESPNVYVEIIHNFQKAKADFYKSINTKYHNVRLPTEFTSFLEEKYEEKKDADNAADDDNADDDNANDNDIDIDDEDDIDLNDLIKQCPVSNNGIDIKMSDEYLEISELIWKTMFNKVIDPTILHIKSLLINNILQTNLKYICLVGGLSCSPFFQFKIKTNFGINSQYKLHLIIPQRPILSVVEGAAYFGITKNYIKSRILRYTYGKAANVKLSTAKKRNISKDYINKNKYYNDYRKKYKVRNIFDVLVEKGMEVKTGQVFKGKQHRHKPSSTHTTITILCSDKPKPKIRNDGKVLAKLKIDFDKNNIEEEVEIEFHFWDTQIRVYAYSIAEPNNKKEIKLNYNIVDNQYNNK